MPVTAATKQPSRQARRACHRELLKSPNLPFVVAVTKMLSRKEALRIPEAMEAMKKEYARLAARCGNERDRRSKDDVIREARAEGREVQFSMVYGIIGEKGSELPPGDPRRKYKGQAVPLGNKVFNHDYQEATFAELGSAPTTLEGSRIVDAYGCVKGNASQTSDAIQAFCQAPMMVEVWVTLQREAVADPEFYYAVKNPVVRLLLALYGHPDSPTFWEDYWNGKVKLVGFNSMGDRVAINVRAPKVEVDVVGLRG